MIIFAIKCYFFFGVESYNLMQKPHTSHFFLFFCGKIIKVVYAMLAIIIKDLKMYLDNSNLLLGKSVI